RGGNESSSGLSHRGTKTVPLFLRGLRYLLTYTCCNRAKMAGSISPFTSNAIALPNIIYATASSYDTILTTYEMDRAYFSERIRIGGFFSMNTAHDDHTTEQQIPEQTLTEETEASQAKVTQIVLAVRTMALVAETFSTPSLDE